MDALEFNEVCSKGVVGRSCPGLLKGRRGI